MKLNALTFCFLFALIMPQQSVAASTLETAGDVGVTLLPLSALGFTFYEDDADGRWELVKGFAANLVVTEALKQSVQRERPNKHDNKSFPSGHTSVSFQAASFIHARYGWKTAAPAYVLASFVGYSRIKTDWHFASDVLAGAIIGAASSYYFTEPINGLKISPMATTDSDTVGIKISTTW